MELKEGQHKVPAFLSALPQKEKARLMKQYIQWKKWEISDLMVKHYQKQLDRLLEEDEKLSPLSWFQWKWEKAKRLGQRSALRKIISDLKES